MAPLGALAPDDARSSFAEQAAALAAGGADAIWIETMSSEEEAGAAIAGAAKNRPAHRLHHDLRHQRATMMGVTPEGAAAFYGASRPALAACGANCGNGLGELVAAIAAIAAAGAAGRVLVAKANCGVPQFVDGEIRYSGTPRR